MPEKSLFPLIIAAACGFCFIDNILLYKLHHISLCFQSMKILRKCEFYKASVRRMPKHPLTCADSLYNKKPRKYAVLGRQFKRLSQFLCFFKRRTNSIHNIAPETVCFKGMNTRDSTSTGTANGIF